MFILSDPKKKYLLAAILVILAINASLGQAKLGLKLTSSIISQRVSQDNDSIQIGHGSNAFVPSFALLADFPLSTNYYFATGIGYISKRVNLVYNNPEFSLRDNQAYNIQYIQLPATIKLYTNEVALDKRLYFQFGPIIEIAVHNKESKDYLIVIQDFQPVDITLLLATGMEFQLGPNTALMAGFHYSRGLINIVKSAPGYGDLVIKNDLFGIDLALKF